MKTRNWTYWTGALLALLAVCWGCGGDDDKSVDPNGTTQGQYEVYAGFVSQEVASSRDSETETMVFIATVERINASDPSAKEAVVTVDGTTIPLNTAVSTDDDATFHSTAITYSADSTYAVSIAIGGKTATASLETPDYQTTVAITTPLEGATFTPGAELAVGWTYTGNTPGAVVLSALGDGDTELADVTITGTTTTYTFPSSTTADWDEYEQIDIVVGIGETQDWSGDMAYTGSYSFVLIATASVTITPEGGASGWTITVTPASSSVIVGQSTQVTVTVADGGGQPAPAGTTVEFTVSPSGSGTVSPTSATTTAGLAQTTFTAGSTPTTATVTATVESSDGSATIDVEPEGTAGQYGLTGLFLVDDTGGNESFIMTTIARLNTSDPGANTFDVDLNQTALQLVISDANSAMYMSSMTYTPGTTYTWTAAGEAGTATASIAAPSYSTVVRLTSPENNAEYTVGTPVVVAWEYTGDTPDSVDVVVAGDDYQAGGDEHLFYQRLPGTTTSHSFPTDSWDYDTLIVNVTISKSSAWTGSIVDPDSSRAMLIISTDLHNLYGEGYGPGPGGEDWSVYFSIDSYYITQGSSSDATVDVEDEFSNPCEDGTQVTFTVDPVGAATVSPNPATTTGGTAEVTVTAVAASGSVEITASALEDSDSEYIEIGEPPAYIWAIQTDPNPSDPPLSALPVGQSVRVDLSIEDVITSTPYPDDVDLVLSAAFGTYVTISPSEVTVPGGGGVATVTVTGVAETTLAPEIISIQAPEVSEEIIPTGGFMVTVVS